MNKKNLKEIIKLLPTTILITGAHFSGTDVIGEIIAKEKNVKFYPEKETKDFPGLLNFLSDPIDQVKNEDDTFTNVYNEGVFEIPQFCHMITHINNTLGAVLFITRDIQQIRDAEKAAKWKDEARQKQFYKLFFPQSKSGTPISMIKREIFFKYQLPARPHTFFFDYEQFKVHPYWKVNK